MNYQIGFLSAWETYQVFQCLGAKKMAGLWFAVGDQYPGWYYDKANPSIPNPEKNNEKKIGKT